MRVLVIPIVVDALRTVIKSSGKRLKELETRERIETKQTRALLRSVLYPEVSLRLEETYCHSDSSERPTINAGENNSQGGEE